MFICFTGQSNLFFTSEIFVFLFLNSLGRSFSLISDYIFPFLYKYLLKNHISLTSNHTTSALYREQQRARTQYDAVISPVKRGNTIGSSELSSRGHDVVALVAVAFYVNPLVHVTILDHHHQTGPTLSQVIGGHAFSALCDKFIYVTF